MAEDVKTYAVSTRKTVSVPTAVSKFATELTHHLKPIGARIQMSTTAKEPALAQRGSGCSAGA
jgi:hypothetical protein